MNGHLLEVLHRSQQRWVGLVARGLLIGLLVLPATVILPRAVHVAHAATFLEDCDGDGYDDATGVAVPWSGYDESRGDTPAGPGTADWWIAQNKPPGATDGSGSSGSDSSGAGSTSGGSGSGGSKGSSSSGSSSSASTAAKGGTVARVQAAHPAAPAQSAAVASGAAGAAASTLASAPASVANSASAESSKAASAVGTLGKGGPADAGTGLWQALTVGFTGANKELFAGLGLLAALTLAGGLALGVSAVRGIGSRFRRREGAMPHPEEPVASTT